MAASPIQYDMKPVAAGGAAAYEGTPGPAQAADVGEYKKNPGLRRITLVLKPFVPPSLIVPRW